MLKFFKNIFFKEEETVESESPGRTFNRIFTSEYFNCDKEDQRNSEEIKSSKIQQINELGLKPKFLRYTYKKNAKGEPEILSARLAFQKEVSSQRGNMIHVTELAFTVKRKDFETFEKMANISLKNDFRDLTDHQYNGEERRKKTREE